MLKLLGTLVKISLFAGAVLIAGQLIHFHGRSLSEHVGLKISRIERSPQIKSLKNEARRLSQWPKHRASGGEAQEEFVDTIEGIQAAGKRELQDLIDQED